MRLAAHPWYTKLLAAANQPLGTYMAGGTAGPQYAGDRGQCAAVAWIVTGQAKYAAKCLEMLFASCWDYANNCPAPGMRYYNSGNYAGANEVRENLSQVLHCMEWIRPSVPAADWAKLKLAVNTINAWHTGCLAPGTLLKPAGCTANYGLRITDSDQMHGGYMPSALLDLYGLTDLSVVDPAKLQAGSTWTAQRAYPAGGSSGTPLGGLAVTATSLSTLRNAINYFVSIRNAGGEWGESPEYNVSTLILLLWNWRACLDLAGTEHFPELAAYWLPAARALIHRHCQTLTQWHLWGDCQAVAPTRTTTIYHTVSLAAMLGGQLAGTSEGAYLNKFVAEIIAAQPSLNPLFHRWAFFYDAAGTQTDWRSALPKGYYASGRGVQWFHNGWTNSTDSFYCAEMLNQTGDDHNPHYLTCWQLWSKGEWAITRPQGYSGDATYGEACNGMLIGGLAEKKARGPVAHEEGADYGYLVGNTQGPQYSAGYWNPPLDYLTEWTRSLLYLTSTAKTCDVVVSFDRANATNPTLLSGGSTRYGTQEAQRVAKFMGIVPSNKHWIIHHTLPGSAIPPTTPPAVSGGAITWSTPAGRNVRHVPLLPTDWQSSVIDERNLNWAAGSPSEKGWQVRVYPGAERAWDTFLVVSSVATSGTTVTTSLVQSNSGPAVRGAYITRTGETAVLVMFSGVEAARIITTSYSFLSPGACKVYLADLDATKVWTVNGAALTVSTAGLGIITITTGAGETVTVAAGGAAPPPASDVPVPDVVNLTYGAAYGVLITAGFVVSPGSATSTDTVTVQSPLAQALAAPGSTVTLTLTTPTPPTSPPAATVPVPDVVGKTYGQASSALAGVGLTISPATSTITFLVNAQIPLAGTNVTAGSTVDVILSVQNPVLTQTVPSVVGLTYAAAVVSLAAVNLTPNTGSTIPAASAIILTQSPDAATVVDDGSAVVLTVSAPASTVTIGTPASKSGSSISGPGRGLGRVSGRGS